jgi:hypothetical protein
MEINDCVICSEEITGSTRHTLPCSHNFHHECIIKWIKENTIDMNKSGNKYFKTALVHDKHSKLSAIIALYNSGEFPCPMCKKMYTTMTEQDFHNNFHHSEAICNVIEYRPYYIKFKYALDGFDFNEIWTSQYFCETTTLLSHIVPKSALLHSTIVDKLIVGAIGKIGIQMEKTFQHNKQHETITTFHVLGCNCGQESCLGYSFVPEDLCPCCIKNMDNAISLPHHIDHCSIDYMKKSQQNFNSYIKKYVRDHVDSDSDNNNDDDDEDSEGSGTESHNSTESLNSEESLTTLLNQQLIEQLSTHTSTPTGTPTGTSTNTSGRGGRGRGRGRSGRGRGRERT